MPKSKYNFVVCIRMLIGWYRWYVPKKETCFDFCLLVCEFQLSMLWFISHHQSNPDFGLWISSFFPLNHVMRNNIKPLNHASSFQLVKIQFICQNHLESSFSWLVNASDSAIFIHFPIFSTHFTDISDISRAEDVEPSIFSAFSEAPQGALCAACHAVAQETDRFSQPWGVAARISGDFLIDTWKMLRKNPWKIMETTYETTDSFRCFDSFWCCFDLFRCYFD